MHVMDTALFYPAYMNLSPGGAKVILDQMIANVIRFGGVLTVNWHDRSLAPERLWDQPYIDLLDKLKSQGAWFATATEAIAWFKKRRSASIEQTNVTEPRIGGTQTKDKLPGLRVELHEASAIQDDRSRNGVSDSWISERVASSVRESSLSAADRVLNRFRKIRHNGCKLVSARPARLWVLGTESTAQFLRHFGVPGSLCG